jgi:CBS domain-containing protein
MNKILPPRPRLGLAADTAAELMSPNPVSIRAQATVIEALDLLADRGFGAAPVIDDAGRPVGVLSRTDVLVHERDRARRAELEDATDWDEPPRPRPCRPDELTTVRDLMTPVLFTVGLGTTAAEVVKQMLSLKVHHLFVVDDDDALVGVISSLDVLRHLRPDGA